MKNYIDIFRKDNREKFTIEYDSQSSIKNLKEKIKNLYEIPLFCQKLYFNNKELLDTQKVSNVECWPYPISLYSLNKLNIDIYINNRFLFCCFLEACETIFDLKLVISKKVDIPVDKIKIAHSKEKTDDNKLIENFLPDLSFEIIKVEDKIRINLVNEGHKEIVCVNKFSSTDDIFNLLKLDYVFRLKYNNKYIFPGKFLFEYRLRDYDTIEIIRNKSDIIQLIVKYGAKMITVEVYPEDPIYILAKQFNLKKESDTYDLYKLFYHSIAYNLFSDYTFSEIGVENNSRIIIDGFIPVG